MYVFPLTGFVEGGLGSVIGGLGAVTGGLGGSVGGVTTSFLPSETMAELDRF